MELFTGFVVSVLDKLTATVIIKAAGNKESEINQAYKKALTTIIAWYEKEYGDSYGRKNNRFFDYLIADKALETTLLVEDPVPPHQIAELLKRQHQRDFPPEIIETFQERLITELNNDQVTAPLLRAIQNSKRLNEIVNDASDIRASNREIADILKRIEKVLPELINGHKATGDDQDSTPSEPLQLPETYCQWIAGTCSTVEADKLYGKGKAFPLHLPEIFIPLYTDDPRTINVDKEVDHKEAGLMGEKQQPVNIETLISRYKNLLIEGQAGSGKTTLLKHVACGLSGVEETVAAPEGLEGYLPVLIFLKDVEIYFRTQKGKGVTGKDALIWCLENKMGGLISMDLLDRFLSAGQVLFLVDGLDEISDSHRDIMVETLNHLLHRHSDNRILFAGRPHGLEGTVVQLFGDRRIRIHALTPDQVELFIERWFTYLYPGTYSAGGKNAAAMIDDIQGHPATEELVENPLMLTAVCILYHDKKELPEQRAELYQKFIDNMLFRRFPEDPEPVRDFLSTLALRMHTKRIRSADRLFALDILKEVYEKEESESDKLHQRRLKKIFTEIEPACGLLRPDKGEYAFWHLTFQEFLTAAHLMDNASDYLQEIEPYWDDEWYLEVVELYVGLLSLQSKKMAGNIVVAAMRKNDVAPFLRWRLAGRALVDIPRNRRVKSAVNWVHQGLLNLINIGAQPKVLAEAGEIIGRLGDSRNDLKDFVSISGERFEIGKYPVVNAWFGEFIKNGGYENVKLWTPEVKNG